MNEQKLNVIFFIIIHVLKELVVSQLCRPVCLFIQYDALDTLLNACHIILHNFYAAYTRGVFVLFFLEHMLIKLNLDKSFGIHSYYKNLICFHVN